MTSTKSLFEEISSIATKRDSSLLVESRAEHIIASVINLIHLIQESYSPEQSADLNKRLINAIRTEDVRKFTRGMRKIKEQVEHEN
jgi:hypothetical protein